MGTYYGLLASVNIDLGGCPVWICIDKREASRAVSPCRPDTARALVHTHFDNAA